MCRICCGEKEKEINEMQNFIIFLTYYYDTTALRFLMAEMTRQGLKVRLAEKQQDVCSEADGAFVLTDDASCAMQCNERRIPYLFLLNENNKQESLPSGAYCIESLMDISFDYVKKVYQRAKGLPWEILTTDRLKVREITVEDVPRLYELYADESITKYMEPLFPTQKQEEEYTSDYIQNVYHFYGYGMWLIVLKETDEVIGRAGLEYKEGFEGLELGFMLGKEYQHKGYAYEACTAILEYAREELEQVSFRAVVHQNNEPSKHLCKKLGFVESCRTVSKTEEGYVEYCINGAL